MSNQGPMARIRKSRGVPAKRGMRVYFHHNKRFGTIRSANGGYLKIQLDGDKWSHNYHPTWKLDYLAADGSVLYSSNSN